METLRVADRDLVLLAGLPGAGKTTLLDALARDTAVTVRDPAQVREPLRARLPRGLPYRLYRPVVYACHQVRLFAAVFTAGGPVVVADPATRAVTRHTLAAAARLSGRRTVFVWLDASPEQALRGQHARDRVLPARSFAKHVARGARLRTDLLAGARLAGWDRVVLVDRAGDGHPPKRSSSRSLFDTSRAATLYASDIVG